MNRRRPRRRTLRDASKPSWKDKLVREHTKAEQRNVLARLRAAVKAARLARNDALVRVRAYCRGLRKAAQASNAPCALRAHEEASTWAPKLDGAIRSLDTERREQKQLREIESWSRRKRRAKSTAKERKGESDAAVRANIPVDLHALFNKVKRQIKGTPHISRTEAFLQYAEENPSEVFDVQGIEDETERMIRAHEAGLRASRDPRSKSARDVRITKALVERVADAVASRPEFRGSAGRVPSFAWVSDQIEDLHKRADDERHLTEMVIARRRDMIGRHRGIARDRFRPRSAGRRVVGGR